MVAIVIVVVVGSLNDWQKEKQFKALNEKKEDRTVKVIRDGLEKVINIKVIFLFFRFRYPCINILFMNTGSSRRRCCSSGTRRDYTM